MLFRHTAIDVWGNAHDGYDINMQVYCKETTEIDLDNDSDTDIIKKVRKTLGHRADARGYMVEANKYAIEIYRKHDRKPCYFLVPEDAYKGGYYESFSNSRKTVE